MTALPRIQAARGQLVALRHDLHAHPELAFDEHRTAGKVADFLAAGPKAVTAAKHRSSQLGITSGEFNEFLPISPHPSQ